MPISASAKFQNVLAGNWADCVVVALQPRVSLLSNPSDVVTAAAWTTSVR